MRRFVVMLTVTAFLVAAMAVPAFAQAVAGDVNLTFVDCSQVQAAAATQTNEGDAEAGNLGSAAAISQTLTIDQSQVNACLGGVAAGDDIVWWTPWWWWF